MIVTNRQVALVLAVVRHIRAGYTSDGSERVLRDAQRYYDWLEEGRIR